VIIEPFEIAVPDEDVDDLRRRLHATRWPAAWADLDWSMGVELGYLRALCTYWADDYDWRAQERRLNAFPQFRTEVDGATLHFLHVRSPEPDALPVVMTHGRPGSVVEFVDVIRPLTDPAAYGGDPADALHLVVPSIPGYGFSGPTRGPGWDTRRTARALAQLMAALGYARYGAQGGDWGATISAWLGHDDPDHVVGIHLNTVAHGPTPPPEHPDVTEDEQRSLDRVARYLAEGAGYGAIQATRPNTVGVALDDSPAGLCAWIVDKFWDWSDHRGDLSTSFDRDQILTDVSVYWFTRTATSAARLYAETRRAGTNVTLIPYVDVPTGCAIFPAELTTPSRRWAELRCRVVHHTRQPRGGHFAAYEAPDLFVDDVRAFFRLVRSSAEGSGVDSTSSRDTIV
jgi:pimeloyl-ACP methyl ester carboxylesterase